jgi:hypothetical protein
VVPIDPGATVTNAVFEFSGTVTVDGRVATFGSRLASFTTTPPGPAATGNVIPRVPDAPNKLSGSGERTIVFAATVI